MTIAGVQRQVVNIAQKFIGLLSTRHHHSLPELHQHRLSMSVAVPRFTLQPEVETPGSDNFRGSDSLYKNPFMDLMAVPKRKVTPSRKGKRNGPKAYKPVTVIAKCK
ncbi:hypothetical protein R1sor_027308 [Riccia sorocarpa]|uniref:Large ribosomal subunit protein bL32m n=1 Tax=Riccia sorocarpa TaxID=122646 RepID=A0ABD3GGZ7_9MARC